MPLSPDQVRRYARHVLLPDVGGVGQARLLAARVLVPDAGGAGAAALLYLAAAGVGTLVVADARPVGPGDRLLYEASDEGRPRSEAARDRLTELNPDVTVETAGGGDADRTLVVPEAADPIRALAEGAAAAARLIREIVA